MEEKEEIKYDLRWTKGRWEERRKVAKKEEEEEE